jgi:NAD(P)-dependent dehydrogenase (short-subunit alcohol dehydrogenase family)
MEAGGEAELEHMWDVNARAPWRTIRAAWPHLRASGSGRIVNIASMTGLRVKTAEATGYAMSKFALVALTHGVRLEGWQHGIRAAALCPGFVATDMTDGWTSFPRAEMLDAETVAETAALLIALPNNASVASLALNCQPEAAW